jgi:RNA recognition motif-containing protein
MMLIYRFGFVTFRNEETAELALKSPSQKRVLDGRVVAFSKAEPKKEG